MKQNLIKSTIDRSCRTGLSSGLLVLAGLVASSTATAQITVDDGCAQDVAGFGLNCTANDIGIATATEIVVHDDGCAFIGDTVNFTAKFEVELTAQARHDLGIYFSRDGDPNGDGAKTGACTVSTLPYTPDQPWLDLDGTDDDPSGVTQDLCGDIDDAHSPLFPTLTLTVLCVDADGDNQLDLPYCTSWRQPGANDLCTTPRDAYPGAPSKCRCDVGFNVPIFVPNKQIEVIKDLIPSTDDGLFDLQIDGTTEKTDASDGDTTGPITVDTGTFAVGEIAGTGTTLSRYDASIVCVERGTTTEVASCTSCTSVDVSVPDTGGDYVCTITNELKEGSITVIKTVKNDDGGTADADDFTIFLGDSGTTSFVGEEDPGTTRTFDAGTSFSVTESMGSFAGQYSESKSGDCSGVIEAGVDKTCTITNDDIGPKLTLIKKVTNDNGGNAQPNDFLLTVGGNGVSSGFKNTYAANTALALNETQQTGYTFMSITGDSKCPAVLGGTVTLTPGDDISCTITNDDVAPKLTLIKKVTNDNGGNAQPNDFLLTVGGNGVSSGFKNTYAANTALALNETQQTGYTFVSITGDSKCPAALGGTVTLDEGDDITCTITNNDVAPKLTLIKKVTNDDGGNAQPNDFLLTVGGSGVSSGAENSYAANTPLALDETQQAGYTFVSITGDQKCPAALGGTVTLDEGDDITCTITNNDVAPKLTLIKKVTNDDGGNAQPNDFKLTVDGNGVTSGAENTYAANTALALNETQQTGYTFMSITGDAKCPAVLGGTVTLTPGDDISCTITNDDVAPKLTLIKKVTNDDGGNAQPNDFLLTVGGSGVSSGAKNTYAANTALALNETQQTGYSFVSITGDAKCPALLGGTVTLTPGDDITCTITNNDAAPKLTLIKKVTNDDGGNAPPNDFLLTVDGNGVSSGAKNSYAANTPLALDETQQTGYTFVSITGDQKCPAVLGGTVTLDEGDDISCTITNDDIAPKLTLIKNPTNNDGGNAQPNDFLLTVDGNGVTSGAKNSYAANTPLALDETQQTGYTFVSITGDAKCPAVLGGTVTLDEGDDISCTITNDDVAPKLTLIKKVTNDDGGNAQPNDFLLTVGGSGVSSGAKNSYSANTALALNETQQTGYSFVSITGDAKCPALLGGTVTLDEGDDITCTITNDDIAPKLTLIKNPTNNDGGNAQPNDFLLTVGGGSVSSGAKNSYSANTALALNETQVPGYVFVSITGDAKCPASLGGTVTLDEGDDITCTITNDDIAPGLTIIKTVVGPAPSSDWAFTAPAITIQNGFDLPAAGGQKNFTVSAGTYTITEDAYSTGDPASEWALTSIQCSGAQPLASSPDRGVTCPLALAAQGACTFTNQYAELDIEKTCVSKAPQVGDTVLFSIRGINKGVVPLSVTLDDDKIPAIDGMQFELAAGNGVCEPDEYLDSLANPAAGGGDGCVEFIEPVVIDMPFFDVENEASLSASRLGGSLSSVSVSLLAEASDVCEVPGPATRTRGFWSNRIGRHDENDNVIGGFTCHAFENWVLPEFPGGIDLGYAAVPVATCGDLSAWFFSHSAKNSDDSRRKRSCQTDYQSSIQLAALILNTWLPQNGDPLPGDTVPVREKDVFDFFPNFPSGDGVPETSMVDLIDLLLSAYRYDQLPDGTPCNDQCKRALAGYADMINNSGDNEAIILPSGEEMHFGGAYHADPHASRGMGESLVPNFDCAVRGKGNSNDHRVETQDPNSQPDPSQPQPPISDPQTPTGSSGGGSGREEIPVETPPAEPVADQPEADFVSDVETADFEIPNVLDKAELWGHQDVEPSAPEVEPLPDQPADTQRPGHIYGPTDRATDRAESAEDLISKSDEGVEEEISPLMLGAGWFGRDDVTGDLVGTIRITMADGEAASTRWLTDLQMSVESRPSSTSDWMLIADTAQCSILPDLPLELSESDGGDFEKDLEFRCQLGSEATAEGLEVRVRIEGQDSSGLSVRPLTQGKKL